MMKKLIPITLLAGMFLFFSCRRTVDRDRYPYVELNGCASTTINGKDLRICFDSLISESRCPQGAMCVWQGYALVKLSLSVDGQQHSFRLATAHVQQSFRSDTVVSGYRVRLVGLTPYPGTGSQEPYRAEVQITP